MTYVRIAHAGIVGDAYVTQEAFDTVWEAEGWFIIPPGTSTPVIPPYVPYKEKGAPLGVATLNAQGTVVQSGPGGGGGALTDNSVATVHIQAAAVTAAKVAADVATQAELDALSTALTAADSALDARLDTLEAWKLTVPAVADMAVFTGTAATRRLDVPMSTGSPGNPAAGFVRHYGLTTDKSARVRNPDGAESISVPGWDSPNVYSAGPFIRSNQTVTEIASLPIEVGRYKVDVSFVYEAGTVGDLDVAFTVPVGATFKWWHPDKPAIVVFAAESGGVSTLPGSGAGALIPATIVGTLVVGTAGNLGFTINRDEADTPSSIVTELNIDLTRQQ